VPAGGDVEVTFPVLACAPDPTGATTEAIRRALRSVVPFVERVTGLRYYPPPTLLVDELIVAQVRRTSEVDRRHEPGDTAVLLELLRSLCLVFHGRNLDGDYFPSNFADSLRPPVRGDFDHLRRVSEGGFITLVTQWLAGTDPLTAFTTAATFVNVLNEARGDRRVWHRKMRYSYDRAAFREKVKEQLRKGRIPTAERPLELYIDASPPWDLVRETWRMLAVATVDDRKHLARLLHWPLPHQTRQSTIDDLVANPMVQKAVVDLLKSGPGKELTRIAARYDSVLHRCFDGQSTTLPTTSFPAYAARLMELLVGFVATAEERTEGDGEFENGYSVGDQALDWVDRHHPGVVLSRSRATWRHNGQTQCTWRTTRSGYRTLLADVCRRVLAEIQSGSPASLYVRTAAPTYGAFTIDVGGAGSPVRLAIERGGLSSAVLPAGSPAVLICSDAFDRLLTSLGGEGVDPDRARDQATAFLFTTVVHEHFHAALATAVDSNGHAPAGAADPRQWQAGRHLNEALAAWAQRHAVRDDPDLFGQCSAYIESGEYPDWPYRGADALEREYQDRGIAAIRAHMALLRDDPEIAQQIFDQAVSRAAPAPPT
jgi:hypothetical protein